MTSLRWSCGSYFEKPRTTVGWKGLINDPHLDGSYDINTGLRLARGLLLHLADSGATGCHGAVGPCPFPSTSLI